MRKRTFNINVRVTESEKKRLMRTAKRCGLSLSEYLRKVGLNKKLSVKNQLNENADSENVKGRYI